MEIKKISINDFRGEMGVMRGYNDDSEDIKLVKEYYYTQAVNQLKAIRFGIEKINEDLKIQLTLMNFIKYLRIDLQLYQKNCNFEEILSEDYHYYCECDCNYSFNDVEERLEGEDVGRHFRHMLVSLVKAIAKIE
mgnify:CR=1 FL=1